MSVSDESAAISSAVKLQTWHFWRGTPDLLAHTVRVAERAISTEGASTSTAIDLCVADDHEMFESVSDFTQTVTTEGLRHFQYISVQISAENRTCAITWRWNRPWWAIGGGMDADLILDLRSDPAEVETQQTLIERALLRGGTQRTLVQAGVGFLIATAGALALAIFVVSTGYLLGLSKDTVLTVALGVALTGWIGCIYWGTWAYPSIEVAPTGQSNLRRLIRVAGPILASVGLAGITKALFG